VERGLQQDWIQNANGDITLHTYDAFGRLDWVGQKDDGGPCNALQVTLYDYNTIGNLTQVTRGGQVCGSTYTAGNVNSHMTYDGAGRKLTMNDPDMGNWTYTYDPAGNLVRQKDAKGQALCFAYDTLNRLLRKAQDSTPADACPASLPTSGSFHLASYVYDTAANGIGQLHQVSWGMAPTQNKDTFTYDTLGRMTAQTRLIDNRSYAMQTISFDALHRPLTIRYPNNENVSITYDHEGENTLAAGSDQLVRDMVYNSRGQLTFLDRGPVGSNLPDTTYLYHPQIDVGGSGGLGDSNFRLKAIQHSSSSSDSWPDFTYEYNLVGNISKMTTTSDAGTDTQSFGYDHLSRLKTATATGNVANYSHTYAYDILGNIDSRTENGTTIDYAYNDGAHKQAVTHLNGVQKFWYDANGNMTQRIEGSTTYSQRFDAENRLIEVVNSSSGYTSQFRYDAAGQRTMSLVQTGATSGKIIYTPFPNYEEEVPMLFYSSFETGSNWTATPYFPGSSLYRSTWGSAAPAPGSGSYAYALSNHAYGVLQSDPIAVSANTQYDLYAWVRGELDPDDSTGQWIVRAHFYNSSGTLLSSQDPAAGSPGTLTPTWQQQGGRITTPANTATLRISLYNYMNSGWVAYDDVSLKQVGTSTNLAPNPGFESSSNWTAIITTGFPATSFRRASDGPSAPRSGSYGYAISNHVYGAIRSEKVTGIVAGAQYDVYSWLRGALDPDDSHGGGWLIQVAYYNSSDTLLSTQNVDSGSAGSLSPAWERQGGRITAPANTAKIQVLLYNYHNTGWVAYDDVELIRVGTSTNLLSNPGFESSGVWTNDSYATHPGTAYWRSTWGTASPRSGSYANAISNHVYGYLRSDPITVTPNTSYDLHTLIRGEIDGDGSTGTTWDIRAQYYDANDTFISYQVAASGGEGSLSTAWQERGGTLTTPANATRLRLYLYTYNASGWVTFDNVRLSKPNGSTITRSSYGIAGQMIATRVSGDPVSGNNGLSYFFNDHLGSMSVLRKPNGTAVTTRYLPFGGYRGTTPTQTISDRDFTGQKENMELGLLYYNARYYVPYINRFASADTIVPNPTNPQSYNRYSYTRNNPINFTDPTGHRECNLATGDCSGGPGSFTPTPRPAPLINFTGLDWTAEEMAVVNSGAWQVAKVLYEAGGGQFSSPSESFFAVYGSAVTFEKRNSDGPLGWANKANHVYVNIHDGGSKITDSTTGSMWAVHELGHAFNYELSPNTTDNLTYGQGIIDLALDGVWVGRDRIAGNTTSSYANDNLYVRTSDGYRPGTYSRDGGPYQQNSTSAVAEDYADMFMNWTYNSFASDVYGDARYEFMNNHMSAWINLAVANNQ
jgi:RHS repeat-associated protein